MEPSTVDGIEQKPIEGVSMAYSFDDGAATSARQTQYFEILGNRALYHEGWIASCFHGRVPWIRSAAMPFDSPQEMWELYNVNDDFSQGVDLADEFPEKLAELREMFDVEARKYDVFPLSDATVVRVLPYNRPSLVDGVTSFTLYPDSIRLPELASVNMKNTSFDLTAQLEIGPAGAQGVVICQGGSMAGWSLYVTDGRPTYVYNYFGRELTFVASDAVLPEGPVALRVSFDYDGGGLGKGGTATLFVDGAEVARERVEHTVPFVFSMSGETLDVGVDTASSVGPYPASYPFTGGQIDRVVITLRSALSDGDRAALREGQERAANSIS